MADEGVVVRVKKALWISTKASVVAAVLAWTQITLAQTQPAMPVVNDSDPNHAVEPATIECVLKAADQYGVPGNVLLAIASVENGKNGQVVENTNGTYDIGHFQINTMHWEPGGLFDGKPGITKEDVAWRGCFNAEVAAWILRSSLDENSRQDYWTRASNYHSRTPKYNRIYRERLIRFSMSWANWLEQTYGDRLSVSEQ